MAQYLKLQPTALKELRSVDPRLISYNVEMTEVTGGTFWKSYTAAQRAGTEPFAKIETLNANMLDFKDLMQYYPPIDLTNERLRKFTKAIGPAWVRVSGSWATTTYYDFDGHTGGKAPEGYRAVLTRDQWLAVLDFVRAVGGKLLVSVNNCIGLHKADEPWNPSQAELLFALSKEHGVPIDAAEFTNEPNMLEMCGAPKGYTAKDYARDQDLFFAWVRKNYPGTLCVGPCSTNADESSEDGSGGVGDLMPNAPVADLMAGTTEKLDVYSYHCYNGISERLASLLPSMHWGAAKAHTDEYLAVSPQKARKHSRLRDRYCPGGQMWVTEAGDAGGGGTTWASTYLDVLRTLNEFGGFAAVSDGVIFHNTLASSDYGYLHHGSFDPRPSYFAALLWNRLMGTTVYDSTEPAREGAHVYVHSRRDGKPGYAYMILNNSLTDTTTVEFPGNAEGYLLSAEKPRADIMQLNGQNLVPDANDNLPDIKPVVLEEKLEIPPLGCAFVVL